MSDNFEVEEYKKYIRDVTTIIKANIEELQEQLLVVDSEEKAYIKTRLETYYEVAVTLREQIKVYGIDASEIGLDELLTKFRLSH